MKVCMNIPEWGNRWIPQLYSVFEGMDIVAEPKEADLLFSAWCDGTVVEWSHKYPNKKLIVYARRYELRERTFMESVNWDSVDLLIFVSNYNWRLFEGLSSIFHMIGRPKKTAVIPNGVDLESIPLREEHLATAKIAMIASNRWEKGHSLALQVLFHLPKEYRLYVIGMPASESYSICLSEYVNSLGLVDRVVYDGYLSSGDVLEWLKDKQCLLSTSISEGNPMNVIEAMATGMPAFVHAWPGATGQFPTVFKRADEAADRIQGPYQNPSYYRSWVQDHYDLRSYWKLKKVVQEVLA